MITNTSTRSLPLILLPAHNENNESPDPAVAGLRRAKDVLYTRYFAP